MTANARSFASGGSLLQGSFTNRVRKPAEVMLVLDANTGQNALNQVKAFDDAVGLTGLTITKLDGTAKGGAIAAIARYKPIPVRFVGVGEGIDDLRPFDADEFVSALFE